MRAAGSLIGLWSPSIETQRQGKNRVAYHFQAANRCCKMRKSLSRTCGLVVELGLCLGWGGRVDTYVYNHESQRVDSAARTGGLMVTAVAWRAGIKAIKLHAWEEPFLDRMRAARAAELQEVR